MTSSSSASFSLFDHDSFLSLCGGGGTALETTILSDHVQRNRPCLNDKDEEAAMVVATSTTKDKQKSCNNDMNEVPPLSYIHQENDDLEWRDDSNARPDETNNVENALSCHGRITKQKNAPMVDGNGERREEQSMTSGSSTASSTDSDEDDDDASEDDDESLASTRASDDVQEPSMDDFSYGDEQVQEEEEEEEEAVKDVQEEDEHNKVEENEDNNVVENGPTISSEVQVESAVSDARNIQEDSENEIEPKSTLQKGSTLSTRVVENPSDGDQFEVTTCEDFSSFAESDQLESLLASSPFSAEPLSSIQEEEEEQEQETATTTTTPLSMSSSSSSRHVQLLSNKARNLLRQALLRDTPWEDRPGLTRAALEQACLAARDYYRAMGQQCDDTDDEFLRAVLSQQACEAVVRMAVHPCVEHAQTVHECLKAVLPPSTRSISVNDDMNDDGEETLTTPRLVGSASIVTSTYERKRLVEEEEQKEAKETHMDDRTSTQEKCKLEHVENPEKQILEDTTQEAPNTKEDAAEKSRFSKRSRKTVRNWFRLRRKKQEIPTMAPIKKHDTPCVSPLEYNSENISTITVKIDEGMDDTDAVPCDIGSSDDGQLSELGIVHEKTNEQLRKALWEDETEQLTTYDGVEMFGKKVRPAKSQIDQDEELIRLMDCVGFGNLLDLPKEFAEWGEEDQDEDDDDLVLKDPALRGRSVKVDPTFIHAPSGPPALLTVRSWDNLLDADAAEWTDRPLRYSVVPVETQQNKSRPPLPNQSSEWNDFNDDDTEEGKKNSEVEGEEEQEEDDEEARSLGSF